MEWTGVPRRGVWKLMGELQERGLIELEVCTPEGYQMPVRRRLRQVGGAWTGWTARPGISHERAHFRALASRRQMVLV